MKNMAALMGMVMVIGAYPAQAEVSDQAFEEMKQMLEQALQRIDELEKTQPPAAATAPQSDSAVVEQVAANTATLAAMSWAERIKFNGDFRYRYENADVERSSSERNRQRIRARAGLTAELPGNVEVGFGLATGGDDPVSSNQTLGGAGSSKGINLDLAYFDWQFSEGANLQAGKFKNPLYRPGKNGLLWDGDFRPEGIDVRYETDTFYITGIGTWLESDSRNSASNFSYGFQAGVTPELGGAKINAGFGLIKIKAEGEECYDAPSNSGGNGAGRGCFGNTAIDSMGNLVAGGTEADAGPPLVMADTAFLVSDFTPLELYASADFDTAIPLGLFVDYIKNIDANTVASGPSAGQKLDTAYAVGASLGNGKKQGEWQVKLIYQDKEADSMLGLLTDSDFGGGGTDSKGWVLKGKYMFTDRANLGLTYLAAERQDSNGVENGGVPYDVDTLQLDLVFKYK